MTANRKKQLLLFMAGMIFIPAGLLAQGNHCAAQKSPKKMAVEAGQLVYANQCITCHQADGSGNSAVKTSLANAALVTGNKQALIEYMVNGKSRVGTNATQASPHIMMENPAATNEEISNVLTYIRRSFGNKASMVKASEVKAVREN